jgi:hypothetical protein
MSMLVSATRRVIIPFAVAVAGLAAPGSVSGAAGPERPAAKIETDTFTLEARDATVKPGAEGKLVVQIKAKAGNKVNDQYNHKLKLKAPDGIELPKPELKKADGVFDDKQTFTFTVPVKALRAGTFNVSGEAKFSVCNETQCLIEKREVSATVTAK